MARNRKRTRDRRPRRPDDGAGRAIVGGSDFVPTPDFEDVDLDAAPDPLTHASPDVELAEAQLALGRPENPEPISAEDAELGSTFESEDEFESLEDQVDETEAEFEGRGHPAATDSSAGAAVPGGVPSRGRSPRAGADAAAAPAGAPAGAAVAVAAGAEAERPGLPTRVVTFLQGSWRELQRVQWPDRRQVMQATGVVLGFVIVAGVFLGVADWVAQKIVHFILTK